jgi:hypothetical protein
VFLGSKRLGVSQERMVTVMIEPDDWLTKARQASRRLVIEAGLGDDEIDRMINRGRVASACPLWLNARDVGAPAHPGYFGFNSPIIFDNPGALTAPWTTVRGGKG